MQSMFADPIKPSRIDEHRLTELPFDQYQRYRDLKEVVEYIRNAPERLRLLDVGGGEAGYLPAPSFFPNDLVIVADRHALRLQNYVVGDGTNLPFADGTFDVAFSCDTLEHVSPDRRERFLHELFRVSRRFVILTAPFRSALTEHAEQLVQEVYISECGEPNKALIEHAENGLPDLELTQRMFKNLSVAHLSFPSGNIRNWLIMNSVAFTFGSLSVDLYRCANRIYNERFYFQDHCPPAYRTCWVAAKTENGVGPLHELRHKLAPWMVRSDAAASPGQNSVEESSVLTDFYTWRQALRVLKQVTGERDLHIANLDQMIRDNDVHIANLDQLVRDKDVHIQNLEKAIQSDQTVRETLNGILNSNGWRTLRRYYSLRERVLPKGTKRRAIVTFFLRLATGRPVLLPRRHWHDL